MSLMPRGPRQRDVPPHVKVALALYLVERSLGSSLPVGAIADAAKGFGLHRHTVSKVCRQRGDVVDLLQARTPRPPPPCRLSDDEVVERVRSTPLCQRQSLRSLSVATCIPKTTLMRYLKRSIIQRRISRVKPTLTSSHKTRRLSWALAHVNRPIGLKSYRVRDMFDTVHLDEKWFNLYKTNTEFYLAKDEALPYRSSPNKRYIGKVMFLAAVARPRYGFGKKSYFDGKIDIWHIVEQTVAQRGSKNRSKGSPITKNIFMTRQVYTKMLCEKVFPAIRDKWPGKKSRTIKVQQDNAGPHVQEDNADVAKAGQQEGWNIKVVCQPARSPDMNVLDLGFLNSLQLLQYQTPTFNTDGLIAAVESAFATVRPNTLDTCFLTLQKVLCTVIACKGGNDYSLPRVRKFHLRNGISPTSLPVEAAVVEAGFCHLSQSQQAS
ncbi:hypothetical protein P3T76_011304 [Phytophthora citrophthora]|uniref:Transposase Tc1-like domain-containing protein n=1 Tax=Phytophthora citrophthora TaxID=4793 RepID=A0AAD9LF76_9STRA|nr:hypothetical protein P3T76_011304 [Phytophthora citrophthora]